MLDQDEICNSVLKHWGELTE